MRFLLGKKATDDGFAVFAAIIVMVIGMAMWICSRR